MPITNARFGAICDITETVAASATSAVAATRPVTIGPLAATPTIAQPVQLSAGTTGAPTSCNVILDGLIVLAASGTATIDLTAFNAKALAKCRGYQIVNANAADAGVNSNVTVAAGATNGFTAGGKLTTTTQTVEPNSQIAATNLNSLGWTVNATNKNVVLTAGTAGATVYVVFWGE